MWFQHNHLTPGIGSLGKQRKQTAQNAIQAREGIALWIAHRLLQQVLPQGLGKTRKEHRSNKKTSLNAYSLLWDRRALKDTLNSSLNLLRLHTSTQGWGDQLTHFCTLCGCTETKKAIQRVALWSQWTFVIDFERPRISFSVCKVKHVYKSLQDQGLNV